MGKRSAEELEGGEEERSSKRRADNPEASGPLSETMPKVSLFGSGSLGGTTPQFSFSSVPIVFNFPKPSADAPKDADASAKPQFTFQLPSQPDKPDLPAPFVFPSFSSTSGAFSFASTPASGGAAAEKDGEDDAAAATEFTPTIVNSGPPVVPKQDSVDTGEEEETEEFAVRAKCYEMCKADGGAASWQERGTGKLKINEHKIRGTRRVLMRAEGGVRLIINAFVYSQMAVERPQEKAVRLSAVDSSGKSCVFLLRMASVDDATKLVLALEKSKKRAALKEETSGSHPPAPAPVVPPEGTNEGKSSEPTTDVHKDAHKDESPSAAVVAPMPTDSSAKEQVVRTTRTAQLIEKVIDEADKEENDKK